MKIVKLLPIAALLAGCATANNPIFPRDEQGNALGSIIPFCNTMEFGLIGCGANTYDPKGKLTASHYDVGPGLLPAVIQGGAIIGAAAVLRPDSISNANQQSQGQQQGQSQRQDQNSSTIFMPRHGGR